MLVDAVLINLLEVEKLSHVKKVQFVCYSEHMDKGTRSRHSCLSVLCCMHLFYVFKDAVSTPGYARFTVIVVMKYQD